MKQSILFIDDDSNFLETIKRILRPYREEWHICFAHSVEAALSVLVEVNIDVIVSDMYMPHKNGFHLLEILEQHTVYRSIPVVILTGGQEHELKAKALELGATDLLTKPVLREDLIARLKSVLKLKSYQDKIQKHNELLQEQVRPRTEELEQSRLDIIFCLAKTAEYRDDNTGSHILRVGHYSRLIAQEMNMTPEFCETLFLASPLHDIGKIGIPDNILLKKEKLSQEEQYIMQKHCAIGADILTHQFHCSKPCCSTRENPILANAAEIAMSHHEKWDGSGYPNGIAGQEIPLAARITAIADVYDALRSSRSYKSAFSLEKAMDIISENKGTHFDPIVYHAFEKRIMDINRIFDQASDENTMTFTGVKPYGRYHTCAICG